MRYIRCYLLPSSVTHTKNNYKEGDHGKSEKATI